MLKFGFMIIFVVNTFAFLSISLHLSFEYRRLVYFVKVNRVVCAVLFDSSVLLKKCFFPTRLLPFLFNKSVEIKH